MTAVENIRRISLICKKAILCLSLPTAHALEVAVVSSIYSLCVSIEITADCEVIKKKKKEVKVHLKTVHD